MAKGLLAFQLAEVVVLEPPSNVSFYDSEEQATVWVGGGEALAAFYCSGCLWCTQNCRTWSENGYDYCSHYGPVVAGGANCNK